MNNQSQRTALVAGSTGLVGGFLVAELLASTLYDEVHVLVRRPVENADEKLREHVVDFDHLGAVPRADDVFCCLGTTIQKAGSQEAFRRVDQGYVETVAKLAREQDAERFLLVSSIGADASSKNFYLQVKGAAENAVAALGYPELHVFRPSLLLGPRREKRPAERAGMVLMRLGAPLFLGGLRRYRGVEAAAVARAMAAAARTPRQAPRPGRHVYLYDDIRRLAATFVPETKGSSPA